MHSLFISSLLTLSHTGSYLPLPAAPSGSSRNSYVRQSTETYNFSGCSSDQVLQEIHRSPFSFHRALIKNIAQTQLKNFVVSPLAVLYALSLLTSGIKHSDNVDTFRDAFDIPRSECYQKIGMQALIDHLADYNETGLSAIGGAFASTKMRLLPKFIQTVTTTFRSPVRYIDFENSAERSEFIDRWAEPNMSSLVSADTSFALLNVVYFQGEWVQKFDVANTEIRRFRTETGKPNLVPIMSMSGYFHYGMHEKTHTNFQELPFKSKHGAQNMSLFLLSPIPVQDESPTVDFWDTVGESTIEELMSCGEYGNINVIIPRIRIESEIDMKSAIENAIGNRQIFDPRKTNSKGITESPDLFVDKFVQKMVLEITEEGSEAVTIDNLSIPSNLSSSTAIAINIPLYILIGTTGPNPQIIFAARNYI